MTLGRFGACRAGRCIACWFVILGLDVEQLLIGNTLADTVSGTDEAIRCLSLYRRAAQREIGNLIIALASHTLRGNHFLPLRGRLWEGANLELGKAHRLILLKEGVFSKAFLVCERYMKSSSFPQAFLAIEKIPFFALIGANEASPQRHPTLGDAHEADHRVCPGRRWLYVKLRGAAGTILRVGGARNIFEYISRRMMVASVQSSRRRTRSAAPRIFGHRMQD